MKSTNLYAALISSLIISGHADAGFFDQLQEAAQKTGEVLNSAAEDVKDAASTDNHNVADTPAWANEPLLTSDKCDNITANNIESFVNKYREPSHPKDSLQASGEKLMNSYTLSAAIVNRSLLCTAQSLDMKDTIEQLKLEQQVLLSGTSLSQEQINMQRDYSASANDAIVKKLSETNKVQPEQQKTMGLAFGMFFLGTHYTYEMKKPLETYSNEVTKRTKQNIDDVKASFESFKSGDLSATNFQSLKLDHAKQLLGLVTTLPGHFNRLYSTGTSFTQFARNNKLSVPLDATDAFDEMNGGW